MSQRDLAWIIPVAVVVGLTMNLSPLGWLGYGLITLLGIGMAMSGGTVGGSPGGDNDGQPG